MALKVGELFASMRLDRSSFESGLRAVHDGLAGVGKSIKNLGSQLQAFGGTLVKAVTVPIAGIGAAIYKVGESFDTTLRQIIALTDVTEAEIGGIEDAILKMAVAVGKSPQELAEAFYFLASAGFDTKEALEVLEATAMAAASGMGMTQDLAKVAGAAINAYGKENLTAAQALDIMLRGVKDGTAEAVDFAGALGDVLGTSAQMGVEFHEVTAALSALTLKGINVNEAATSMNQVFMSLLKPTRQAEEAMEDMGLSASGLRKELKEKGLLHVLGTLQEKFEGNDEAAATVFGNVRALRGVLGLLGGDTAQTAAIFDDLAASGGDVAEAFKTTEGPGREMDRAMADIQVTLITLAEDVLPLVVELLHGLRDGIHEVLDWWQSLSPEMQNTILVVAGLAAVLGPLLIALGLVAVAIGGIITFIALVLSPIGLLVAALVAGAALIVLNWDKIWPVIQRVIDIIMVVVNAAIPPLLAAIDLMGQAWTWIAENIIPPVISIIRTFTDIVLPALGAMIGQVVGFIRDHMDFFRRIWDAAMKIAGALIHAFASGVSTALHVVADVFHFIAPIVMTFAKATLGALVAAANFLLPVFTTVFEGISNIVSFAVAAMSVVIKVLGDAFRALLGVVSGVWNSITGTIKGAINAVVRAINSFIRAINGIQIHIPGADLGPLGVIGKFDFNGLNLGQIPYLAGGARNWRGGWAMVGERGPELVNLPGGSDVYSASETRRGGGAGGGPLIGEQNIYGVMPGDVERETRRAFRRKALDWSLEGR